MKSMRKLTVLQTILQQCRNRNALRGFGRSAYVQPLNFIKEIDGTVYAVRAFFKEDARENITDKVQRIVLNDTKSRKQI